MNINDRFSYAAEKSGKKFKTNSIGLNYNFYFGGDEHGSGYVITPMAKYRFGNFEENKWTELVPGVPVEHVVSTNMDSFIIGVGFGYKWVMADAFTIAPFANIGRNFSQKVNDRFSAIEFNAGINIGYRF